MTQLLLDPGAAFLEAGENTVLSCEDGHGDLRRGEAGYHGIGVFRNSLRRIRPDRSRRNQLLGIVLVEVSDGDLIARLDKVHGQIGTEMA